ncbi:MAG: hypothetical protein AB1646_03250 [Thermodesulfobacteriota bacterium]
MTSTRITLLHLLGLAALAAVLSFNLVHGAQYNPCQTPPVVAFGTKPNVIIVQDFSGSMQFPAYVPQEKAHVAPYPNPADLCSGLNATDDYPLNLCPGETYDGGTGYAPYKTTQTYYGLFGSDTYYVYKSADNKEHYWEPADTQPVSSVEIKETAAGTGTTIKITTKTAHGFVAGDVVAIYGLTSHKFLNGEAATVISASSDEFTIAGKWNGIADKPNTGTCIKRVRGRIETGVSGNVLNWASISRMDATLKALFGGRCDTTCDPADETITNCFLRGIGDRGTLVATSGIFNTFYRRPATLTNSYKNDDTGTVQFYPDNYNKNPDATTSNYLDKTTFVTIHAHYTGELNEVDGVHPQADPKYYDKYYELWTFTLNGPTRVQLTQTGAWNTSTSKNYISIYDVFPEPGANSNANQKAAVMASGTASLTWDSPTTGVTYPKTYYVRVTYATVGDYLGTYLLTSNVNLTKYTYMDPHTAYNAAHAGAEKTGIGAIPFARIKVKIKKEERTGILQETFPYVRYGLMMYRTDPDVQVSKQTVGKILIGCQNSDVNLLIKAYQGQGSDTTTGVSFQYAYPWYGTPTGNALDEAVDYFQQADNSNNANNDAFVCFSGSCPKQTYHTSMDPYYDANGNPVPCRKSFVLLIGDGEWSTGTPDPDGSAWKLHATDLRAGTENTIFPGNQNCRIYSIFTFNPDEKGGLYSMQAISMWGAYEDTLGKTCKDGSPYPLTSFGGSLNSKEDPWPRKECCDPANPPFTGDIDPVTGKHKCPTSSVWNDCCREWSKNWDRDEDGSNRYKGVPDTFYQADNGQQLEKALRSIMEDVMSRNAAASAVATVSQETRGGDIIVRGAFEAVDPSRTGKFSDQILWYGHLDTYWPFDNGGTYEYDFEQEANYGLLCYQIGDGAGASEYHCLDLVWCLNNPSLDCYTSPSQRRLFTGWDVNADGRVAYATIDASGNITRASEQLDITDSAIDDPTTGPYLKGLMAVTSDINADGKVDNNDYKDLIAWVKGKEDSTKPFRSRMDLKKRVWSMGDIIYSTPVIQSVPSLGGVAQSDPDIQSYWDFRNAKVSDLDQSNPAKASPTMDNVIKKVVYVGANDGMLHAFVLAVWDWEEQRWCQKRDKSGNDPDRIATPANKYAKFIGKELWAYSPSNLLSGLKVLCKDTYGTQYTNACIHRAMVDLSPDPYYAFFNNSWHVILCGGERGGGDLHFAIDVTDPSNPILLWEFSHLKALVKWIGKTTSSPDFRLPYATGSSSISSYYDELKHWPMTWSRPYVGRLDLPASIKFHYGDPVTGSFSSTPYFPKKEKRHLMFAGGGFRMFDTSLTFSNGSAVSSELLSIVKQPRLVAIDVETGVDLFRYIWPWIYEVGGTNLFPTLSRTATGYPSREVPYAMSDPLVLDLLSGSASGPDGMSDHIYVGDLGGNFYSIKFNFETSAATQGMAIDVRLTRVVDESNTVSTYSMFRGVPQPIGVGAVASYDRNDTSYVRVIVGAGKFDDIAGSTRDDKSDPARTSIYNMKDKVQLPSLTATSYGGTAPGGMTVYLNPKCGTNTTNARKNYFTAQTTGCKWVKSVTRDPVTNKITGSNPDCCKSTCGNPDSCWQCVWDLTNPSDTAAAGERIINRGLIAGGLFFTTSYIPSSDACKALGEGNLYIFDYVCEPFGDDFNPLPPGVAGTNLVGGSSTDVIGVTVDLTAKSGTGVPSAPVLDSSGDNVIVQMSNASLLKIPVNLKNQMNTVQGWRER